jgi:hypothetical protein
MIALTPSSQFDESVPAIAHGEKTLCKLKVNEGVLNGEFVALKSKKNVILDCRFCPKF